MKTIPGQVNDLHKHSRRYREQCRYLQRLKLNTMTATTQSKATIEAAIVKLANIWRDLGEVINDETGNENEHIELLETARTSTAKAIEKLETFRIENRK